MATRGEPAFGDPSQLLWERVADGLRESILDGRLRSGSRLNEVQLARDLQLSRGPLREALRRLEEERLVRSLPNHGTFVARVSIEDALDALRVRRLLEREATAMAFSRNPAALSVEMRSALEQMERAARELQPTAYVVGHSRFHGVAYALSGSDIFAWLWNRIEAPMRFVLRMRRLPVSLGDAVDVHRPLLALLAEGDIEEALIEVDSHVARELQWLTEDEPPVEASL